MTGRTPGPVNPLGNSPGLPRFLAQGRRGLLATLVGTGLTVALMSAAVARLVSLLSREHGVQGGLWLVAALVGLVTLTAGLRVLERRVAERLGQDYVQEIRKDLIRGALGPGRSPSLGITIARTSNDLNSVRNWVTLGIAGTVSGIPLIMVLIVALWLMAPPLAVAVMVPLLGASALLGLLARPTFARARTLRKARGRLAGQVTDTVNASMAIRAAGGEGRELGRIDRLGKDVAEAAVNRATVAGALRASAMGAASAAAIAVAATGAFTGLDRGLVAAALTVVGMISGPVHDLGRIVEYRQSYLAARHSIAPALPRPAIALPAKGTEHQGRGPGLTVSGLVLGGAPVPNLAAQPGDAIRIEGCSRSSVDELFEALLGLQPGRGGAVVLDGQDLTAAGRPTRRRLVGYAARGLDLERGQIRRALRYRCPEADDAQLVDAVERAGLGPALARLPKGDLTVLRRGGDPLSAPERARVQIARAVLGHPPLLLLNHIDADLDPEGLDILRGILSAYPGIVVMATDRPEICPADHRVWATTCRTRRADAMTGERAQSRPDLTRA